MPTRPAFLSRESFRSFLAHKTCLKVLYLAAVIFCAVPVADAQKTTVAPGMPEYQNIENAANLLDKLGAHDVAERVRQRLKEGKYSFDNLGAANGLTRSGSQYTIINTQTIRQDNPGLREKPLDPVKNFGSIFSLARTLYHEDVHSGQGYFATLWGMLPGETTDETDAWTKTIAIESFWIINALANHTFTPQQIAIMAIDLDGYVGSFAENDYYGLSTSLRPTYVSLQQFMQKLSGALSPRPTGNPDETGVSPGPDGANSQPSQPGAPQNTSAPAPQLGITCRNSNDDCGELGRIAAQKQIEAVQAKAELSWIPDWLSQADSLDHNADLYQQQADHALTLVKGYAELNDPTNQTYYQNEAKDYQARSEAARAQAKALRDKANSAPANAAALEKAAQEAWNAYYACLALPPCPQSAAVPNPSNPGATSNGATSTSPGGPSVGGGTGGATTPVHFVDCPQAQSALDSAKFWHQQAVRDLEFAAQAKLEGNSDRAQNWELQARLDEGNARMWEREAAYALRRCQEHKTTTAEQQNTPATSAPPNTSTTGPAQGQAPSGGAASNGAASGSLNSSFLPPNSSAGSSSNVPPGTGATGNTAGGSRNEFSGGKEKRTNLGRWAYVITQTSADGSITLETVYAADGTVYSSRREEPSTLLPGGIRSTYTNDQGTTVQDKTTYSQPFRSVTQKFDKAGTLISRQTFVNTFNTTTGFTEVTETFNTNGTVTTTTRHWTGNKLRKDKPDSETTSTTSTPGLDQVGKDLQKAIDEEQKAQQEVPPAFDPQNNPPPPAGSDSGKSNRGASMPQDFYGSPVGSIGFGDVLGTGFPQIVIGAPPGNPPFVRVFDGQTGRPLVSFFAYDPRFLGGVNLSVGNVDGGTTPEIVTGPGPGFFPAIKIFNGSGQLLNSFLAYDPKFLGGVNIATGDLNGDGHAGIITGAGPGGAPQVKVFSGSGAPLQNFFAYDQNFTGGVFVSAGDVNGDGKAEITTGPGPGGGPQVKLFDGKTGQLLNTFNAYDPSFSGGVRVGVGDFFGNGKQSIFTSKAFGDSPQLNAFNSNGTNLNLEDRFLNWNPRLNPRLDFGFPWRFVQTGGIDQFQHFLGTMDSANSSVFDLTFPNTRFISNASGAPKEPMVQNTMSDEANSRLGGDIWEKPDEFLRSVGIFRPHAARPKRLRENDPAQKTLLVVYATAPLKQNAHRVAPSESQNSSTATAAVPAGPSPEFSVVSNGKTGAAAFEMQVFDPSGKSKQIRVPSGVVLEPVKQASETRSPAQKHPSREMLTQQFGALCLDFAKLPPELGTLYRIAPAAAQRKFRPLRSILKAGHELEDQGKLHPDSEPKAYAIFIRQFAVWARLENWDESKFTEMFLQRARENARVLHVKWTPEMETTLSSAAPGRWRDISAILAEAENISKELSAKYLE